MTTSNVEEKLENGSEKHVALRLLIGTLRIRPQINLPPRTFLSYRLPVFLFFYTQVDVF